jgi:hypothetical protein
MTVQGVARATLAVAGGVRRATVTTVLLGACFAAAPAGAAPQWLAPFDVAPGDQAASQPTAAFGPSGDLAVAWASAPGGSSGVAQARRAAGGAFAAGPTVGADAGATDPVLATAPDGTAYLAWTTVDPQRFGEGAVNVARLAADGSIVQQATVSGQDDASTPALDVAADGRLGVAWVASDDDDTGTVKVAVGSIGSFLVRSVSTGDNNAADPAVAFDAAGALHVAWARLDVNEAGRVKIATVDPAGAVSPVVVVSSATADAGEPDVAADPAFGVAVAWTEVDAAESGTVHLALQAGGAFTPAQTALGGGDASSPDLSVAPSGALRLAWVRTDAQGSGSALVANADGGVLSPTPAVISGADDVTLVRLAYAPTGDGVAVWRRALDPNEENVADIRGAGFDAAGPVLHDLSIPADAVAGTPAAFSVRPVDVWSAVGDVSWDFGDGASAAGTSASHTYGDASSGRHVVVRAVDAAGNASSADGTVRVSPAGAAPPPPPPPPPASSSAASAAPPAALSLSDLASDFACLRYPARSGSARGRADFSFVLSEAATVTLRLQRRMESKPRASCPVARARGRAGHYSDTVVLTASAPAGPGGVQAGDEGEHVAAGAAAARTARTVARRFIRARHGRFTLAQVTQSQALAPGTYVARVSATTADGRRSADAVLKFWVLEPGR